MTAPIAIVLAAGQGTRMRSKTPKVLHEIAGRPLLLHVLAAVREAGAAPVVVLSKDGEAAVRAIIPPGTPVVIQDPPRGTGHAVQQALGAIVDTSGGGVAFVLYGDTPLLRASTLARLAALRADRGAALALLVADLGIENTYGRVVRDAAGDVARIVEARLATAAERALPESNVGAYAFDPAWLRTAAPRLAANETGEVFLTDVVALARADGRVVAGYRTTDAAEGMGVNTRVDLAAAEVVVWRRIRETHMLAGVTFHDPETTTVGAEVVIAADAIIERGSVISGTSRIGSGTRIGPYSIVRDSAVGQGCIVEASVVEGATLEDEVRVGPYSHLRPGAYLERGVELGNFGEVKNARLRAGTKMHHFSYVGDASIGARVNVGAGTITLNYDGANKHHTEVGDDAFIGSGSLLRAPVRVGKGAATGAGSIVTKDVPDGMLAVGAPARAIKKYVKPAKRTT